MNQVGRAAGPRGSFIMVCVVGQIQGGDPSGRQARRRGLGPLPVGAITGRPGRGPGGESPVQVGGVDEAELLQGRCGQARLVSLVADQDYVQVPVSDGGVPPLRCGVAAPFRELRGTTMALGWKASPFPDCGNCIFLSCYLRFQELVANLLRGRYPFAEWRRFRL